MQLERRLTIGELLAALSYVGSALGACIFAYTFLVGDVETTKAGVETNTKAIKAEQEARIREDQRLARQFEARAIEIKNEIKHVEERQRFLLDDMRNDIKFLVRDRRADEQRPSVK